MFQVPNLNERGLSDTRGGAGASSLASTASLAWVVFPHTEPRVEGREAVEEGLDGETAEGDGLLLVRGTRRRDAPWKGISRKWPRELNPTEV